jgi:membrane peptidoglycan carboxypeptidase
VVSTFDRDAQAAAVAAVREEGPESGTDGLRIGLAAVRPGTGEVVAMYGGEDYVESPVNNATQAIGQAGSTFKAFALAAAVEDGISLDSTWNGNTGVDIDGYTVNNYGDRSWGRISLLKATEQSVNSAYVAVSKEVGYDKVVDAAERAGIPEGTPALEPVRSVALGVASPHAVEVAGAYATFAARGQQADVTVIKKVTGPNGGVLIEVTSTPEQAFDSDVADAVNFALSRVVTSGTGSAAQALGRPSAGKTGTTNENMSAWYVGYTPQISAAVMFVKDGDDGDPVSLSGVGGMSSVTGGSFPARIWTAFMRGALEGQPVERFVTPSDLPTGQPSPSPSETSATPTPTESSATPTPTPTPSDTPTPTPTPTPTETVSPTPTDTATPEPSGSESSSAPPDATAESDAA